jgi:endonuclease/exonuclease/phosphatase family metal-dependent hydrolase
LPASALRLVLLLLSVLAMTGCGEPRPDAPAAETPAKVRFATFNASLYADAPGGLERRLRDGDERARAIAAVIQHVRPDVLLLNEFDHDAEGRSAALFAERYLAEGQHGQAPIRYRYVYSAEVNTGVPSGLDLGGDGRVGGEGRDRANDAWGYGLHPGQYGMLVLSRYPIDTAAVRTFRLLRWSAMPGALQPLADPAAGTPYYAQDIWSQLRLSSKSHWDVPIDTPAGRIHLLAAHPTPPVFDGPERRNALRNHDEIRLWADYLDDAPADAAWLCDDAGRCGGLPDDAAFVIAGDYNADPADGGSLPGAIAQLLEHPRVQRLAAPRSDGALAAAADRNAGQRSFAGHDTAQFGRSNFRVDYVLPSVGLPVRGSGVFWPAPGQPGAEWLAATDHRLVWVDVSAE